MVCAALQRLGCRLSAVSGLRSENEPVCWRVPLDSCSSLPMQSFRNLQVWDFAHRLTLDVYASLCGFPPDERFGLTSQLRRASASIPTNLAEGCGRGSDADFARFVQIALGSASEVQYLVLLAHDLGYVDAQTHERLNADTERVKRMLTGLRRRLHHSASKRR
ncbi:MAG: four helix bundle protein [Bacteroidota bacterium]